MIDVALDLEARGADYISLSDGGGYEDAAHLVGSEAVAEHIPDSGADFKRALKVPVFVAPDSKTPPLETSGFPVSIP